MAEQRVAVEVHFGVEAEQLAVLRHHQRVDFEQAHVLVEDQLVEPLHHLRALFHLVALEAQRECELARVERLQTRCRIDRHREDLVWRIVRHLLDVHAAFGRGDERDARGCAINERGEIELAGNIDSVLDIDASNGAPRRAGLDGDESVPQHLLGELLGLARRLGEANAALVARRGLLELALAASAGMDLRLDHDGRRADPGRGLLDLVRAEGDEALAGLDAVFCEKVFSLMLVDVHELADPVEGQQK